MLELQKTIAAFLMPVGTAVSLGLLALLAGALKRKRLAILGGVLSVGWLWMWSLAPVSDSLRFFIETRVPAKSVSELPTADLIVVLGGGVSGQVPPWRPYPDMSAAADRVWHAARLYHAGKAQRILLSGGQAMPSAEGDEASAMAALLRDFGVPAEAMILEKNSRNTSGNAKESIKIITSLGVHRVLLVTSALHMPRALLSFRNRGFEVIPASTDVEVVPRPRTALDWIPDASALGGSTYALHEVLGIARCRVLGC